MISIVSLGSKFSGGGIVLHDIIAATESKTVKIRVIEPPQLKSRRLQQILQILWILFWPLRLLATPTSTILVAHSLFLISPFAFVLGKRNLFFLFQGEEYKALRSPKIICVIEWWLKSRFSRYKCIATNDYLKATAESMGGQTLPIKTSLGPKHVFFQTRPTGLGRRQVIIFARDGYNKGLDAALEVAGLIRNKIVVVFITPDESIAYKLRSQGFKCLVSVDPAVICTHLFEAFALFLPSHYEGLSLPMLEALAVGTPVVTYAEGFPRFYSQLNSHVKFIENRNPVAAANTLIDLYSNEIYMSNFTSLIDSNQFSFEKYCDEVANSLFLSIK